MSLAPTPSSSRGDIILQPAYFTSSAFVYDARADVDRLVNEYSRQYTRSAPFALFKYIWQTHGWTWIHFRVFDARTRAAFLSVMMRLFSERIAAVEPPLIRVAALFGLYTMYLTQPSSVSLYFVARVQIPRDLYKDMLILPDALDGEHLHPVRPHVIYVQSQLLQAHVFHVLPHEETHPQNPRALPREVVIQKRDSEGWHEGESQASVTRDRYVSERSGLVSAIGEDERWLYALRGAGGAVIERIEMIDRDR